MAIVQCLFLMVYVFFQTRNLWDKPQTASASSEPSPADHPIAVQSRTAPDERQRLLGHNYEGGEIEDRL